MLLAAALIFWAVPPWHDTAPAWRALPPVLLACLGIYQLNRLYDGVEDAVNDPAAFARDCRAQRTIQGVGICATAASILLSVPVVTTPDP